MKHSCTHFFCFLLFALALLPTYRAIGQQEVYCSGDRIQFEISGVPGVTDPVRIDTVFYNNTGSPMVVNVDLMGLHYDFTVNSSYTFTESHNICDSYTWNVGTLTRTYTESGTDSVTLKSIHGCDSVRRLTLTIRHSTTGTVTKTACDAYAWHGTTYTTSTNTPTYHTSNAAACDSTATLHLTVNYGTHNTQTERRCHSYRWQSPFYDQTYTYTSPADTNSHTYTQSYINADNCPSTDTLRLRLYENDTVTEGPFVQCDSMLWRGEMRKTTMDYQDVVANAIGGVCDSVYRMHLDIHPSYTDTLTTPVEDLGRRCGDFEWHGITYHPAADSARAYATVQTHGCDSLVAMKVMVYSSSAYIEPDVLRGCGFYRYQPVGRPPVVFYHDTLYTRDTLQATSVHGCDSVVQIQVRIYPTYNDTIPVTACSEYTWVDVAHLGPNGERVGDSVYRANATLGPVTYQIHSVDGEVCDSIVTIELTVLTNETVRDTTISCFPIRYGDSTYSVSTVVYDTLSGTAENGCFRIGEHHIVIRDTAEYYDTVHACYYYVWHTIPHYTTTDTVGLFATQYGCDSTVHLHIVVHDSTFSHEVNTVCGDTTWNGIYLPEVPGSVVVYDTTAYHIPNLWGCDSSTHITLTVKSNAYGHTSENVCDQFLWDNQIITHDTTVSYRSPGLTANGCDTFTYVHLSIRHRTDYRLDTTVCNRFDFYTGIPARNSNPPTYYHGTFTESDSTYQVALTNTWGCDSIVTLNLVVNHNNTGEETRNACDSLQWNGVWYYESGDQQQTLTNANGCDSVATLHLNIHQRHEVYDEVHACDSYTWPLNGGTYRHNSTTIRPSVMLTDRYGCDSLVTLHLTLNYSNRNGEEVISACDSLVWHGNTYYRNVWTASFDTLTSAGCDSTVTLRLNIRHSVSGFASATACDSIQWHTGNWYTESTVFNDTLRAVAVNGCDSINTIHLTINHSHRSHEYVTNCGPYTWEATGKTYNKSGNKFHKSTSEEGCPIRDTLTLTIVDQWSSHEYITRCAPYTWEVNGITYTESAEATHEDTAPDGCPIRDTLSLTILDKIASHEYVSHCGPYTWDVTGKTYGKSGDKYYNGTTPEGCPVYDTLTLTVVNKWTSHEYITSCDSYTWDVTGKTYYKSGDKYFKHIAEDGCPVYDTLTLTVASGRTSHEYVTHCGPYTWNVTEKTYNKSGDKYFKSTTPEGCPIRDTLTLTIANGHISHEHVTHCGPYTWNVTGKTYNESSKVTYNSTTPEGCPIRDTLTLTIIDKISSHEYITSCSPYTWDVTGKTYNQSGEKYYKGTAPDGCPIRDTLTLTIVDKISNHEYVTHCGSYTWDVTGKTYNKSGDKYFKSTTEYGCPVYDTLTLTIVDKWGKHDYITSCKPYTWNVTGITYNQSGDILYNGTSEDGCPVHDTLTLTITDKISSHEYVTQCGPYTWEVTGKTYNQSGDKFYKGTTKEGCPVRDTLTLTIVNKWASHEYATSCGPYTWDMTGHTYNQSGDKFHKSISEDGCHVYDTLTLTIIDQITSHEYVTHCGPYTWEVTGQTYNQSGDKYYNGTTPDGCPVYDTLTLIVAYGRTSHEYVTHCGPYTWEVTGKTYNQSGDKFYKSTTSEGCPIRDTLTLVVNPIDESDTSATATGSFTWYGTTFFTSAEAIHIATNRYGCDSLITLHLTINPEAKETESSAQAQKPQSIKPSDAQLSVYPNPTTGRVQLNVTQADKIEVLDLVGRLVSVFENTNKIDLSGLADGTYTLRITMPEGVTLRKVVKH